MKKLEIEENVFNINYKFYFSLKNLIKLRLNDTQIELLFESSNSISSLYSSSELLFKGKTSKTARNQRNILDLIFSQLVSDLDFRLFIFALKLYSIKDLMLEEAKLRSKTLALELSKHELLSLKYDELTIATPYGTRINALLLSLLFFERLENNDFIFMGKDSENFLKSLCEDFTFLKKHGVKQSEIYMLNFSECVNQSIKSLSGGNYEERILRTLINIGIDEASIEKTHDEQDSSTEFDFFFHLNGKSYGVGAKRTLRERYKQFIKTANMTKLDVMIEITLGIDLTETKAKAILDHGVILFVASEVYEENIYLQNLDGIYPSKSLTLQTLIKLAK